MYIYTHVCSARYLESQQPSRRKEVQMKKLRNEAYSLWMDMLYRLSLANHVSLCIMMSVFLLNACNDIWCVYWCSYLSIYSQMH